MSALLVGALLVVLHRSDGGEVAVAPGQVTTLRTPVGAPSGLKPGLGCIVGLTDGKWVAVLEGCNEVKRRLEEINR
jgi:hypothetical protein